MSDPIKPYILRDYQQDAVNATLSHFRQTQDPAVIVLPTGAGKSLVIAELANIARGRVLCLTHVKELVEQNHAKFCLTGRSAGIYSAGLKQKSLDHQVTFASVQSVLPNLNDFKDPISLLVIDECHRVAMDEDSQYQKILAHLSQVNPDIKTLGLTATPFRLGFGWIYQNHYHGFNRSQKETVFKKCIYELPLRYMIKHGFLTPPTVHDATIANYDFSALETNAFGNASEKDLNHLIGQYPRVTQAILEQVIELAKKRTGVMIFAATVKHANEIMGYLSAESAALITGATSHGDRDQIIQDFKQKRYRFLVNVSVLTTGFDAPHVDMIAVLRPTQSISLYQQIVGRGLRLDEGKESCLILDYAGNGYDLFAPEVGEKKPNKDSEAVMVECPQCGFQNTFWGKTDEEGQLIEHYGRRCHGLAETPDGEEACDYRFKFKSCPHCDGENDIAARVCQTCHSDIIDPDELLKKALNLKDAKVIRCAGIKVELNEKENTVFVRYFDEDGNELTENFKLNNPARRKSFQQEFVKRIASGITQVTISQAKEITPFLPYLPHPDFVIARKSQHYWKVTQRLFDYQGAYRKANQLSHNEKA
ncbi:putative helicase [Marinomonas sp. MED121]|uniref:DEAD/DEAH box helicase n=1 Tax=Marinomonas sp. MED121 TaxID=314277 RepID=UPI000068FD36|nr:DEAD/DEAH box helicase [Marinomonas sp. MED121]EAQ63695.1 putative helicase [Marinomonas sp. MED121]